MSHEALPYFVGAELMLPQLERIEMTDEQVRPKPAMVRTCENCHNALYVMPLMATDQVLDAEGMVLCNCGAPKASVKIETEWTP